MIRNGFVGIVFLLSEPDAFRRQPAISQIAPRGAWNLSPLVVNKV
jgi:hypothetical protein